MRMAVPVYYWKTLEKPETDHPLGLLHSLRACTAIAILVF
jgi:hypothetical protein